MAAKGGLSLSPNWNQAGSEERVIGRLCRREAVPLTRSGANGTPALKEWARSALVKIAVRLSLFWGLGSGSSPCCFSGFRPGTLFFQHSLECF